MDDTHLIEVAREKGVGLLFCDPACITWRLLRVFDSNKPGDIPDEPQGIVRVPLYGHTRDPIKYLNDLQCRASMTGDIHMLRYGINVPLDGVVGVVGYILNGELIVEDRGGLQDALRKKMEYFDEQADAIRVHLSRYAKSSHTE